MLNLGFVRAGSTINIPVNTYKPFDGSSVTSTDFTVADVLIYKNGGTTERASTSGMGVTVDFDSKTGKHTVSIDLSDDTTADHYANGSELLIGIDAVTVDGVTVGGWIARLTIGLANAILNTTIATYTSSISFTLTDGPNVDSALNLCWAVVQTKNSKVQWKTLCINQYTGSTKAVTLYSAFSPFILAVGDAISVIGPMPVQSNIPDRMLTIASDGVVLAHMYGIITTALSESSTGRLTNAFKTFFNVASPVATSASVNQTGDSFTRIGANGAGLTSLGDSRLNNLDVAISVIQSQVTALNNLSAKANWFGYPLLEIPDSSTRAYVFEFVVKDDEDKLTDLDGLPTITLTNAAGTDRSALITTGVANPSTGKYTITVTVGTNTVNESLKLAATGTVSGETRYAAYGTQVVDYDTATLVNQILTLLGTPVVSVSADIANVPANVRTNLTTELGRIDENVSAVKTLTAAYDAAKTASSQTSVNTVSTNVSAIQTVLSGITSLGNWLRRIARKDAGSAGMIAAEAEITTGGTATYLGTTDNLEAVRDAIAGAGGSATLANQETIIEMIDSLGEDQLAAITVESGVIGNFPETLTIGDSYTSNTGQIKVVITDADGDPITTFGSLELDEAEITFTAFRPNDSAVIEGTCEFVNDTTETYVLITLPSSQTSLGKAEYTYEGRLKFFWEGPSTGESDDEQKTYKTTPFKFVSNP